MSKIRNKLKENVKKLKTDIPALFIAFSDKETPISARILAGIIIVYALSPIDLIPVILVWVLVIAIIVRIVFGVVCG